jgi:hypothetical protein
MKYFDNSVLSRQPASSTGAEEQTVTITLQYNYMLSSRVGQYIIFMLLIFVKLSWQFRQYSTHQWLNYSCLHAWNF